MGAGGIGHGGPQQLVDDQQGVDLLVDAVGGTGPQDRAAAAVAERKECGSGCSRRYVNASGVQCGRDSTPGAAIVDSQSVRASERGGLHGYDGRKKVSGIKHHLLVDTRGTVLLTCVSPADVGDRDGAAVLFSQAAESFPHLRHVWADQGYRGTDFHAWAQEATGITVQIVQRRDGEPETPQTRPDGPVSTSHTAGEAQFPGLPRGSPCDLARVWHYLFVPNYRLVGH